MKLFLTLVMMLTYVNYSFSCSNPEECYLTGNTETLNTQIYQIVNSKINQNSHDVGTEYYLAFHEHFSVHGATYAVKFGNRMFTLEIEKDTESGYGFLIYLHNARFNEEYSDAQDLAWLSGARLLGGNPIYYCTEGQFSSMGDPNCGVAPSQRLWVEAK